MNKSEIDAWVPSILEDKTASRFTKGRINKLGLGIVSPTPASIDTDREASSSLFIN